MDKVKFSLRLQQILDEYDLTASSFAEQINVGRSSISHILSGRNNPSLDFILKINAAFPEIDLYWLLKGQKKSEKFLASPSPNKKPRIKQNQEESKKEADNTLPSITKEGAVERIVILYKNGTFKSYDSN